MLTIHHLSKTFHKNTPNEKTALKKLDLRLQKGDFVTVIGSNGAGKSTLFQAICGSFLCDEGHIFLDGQEITFLPEYQRARVIGHIFQDPLRGTAPSMTIEENLSLAYLRSTNRRFGNRKKDLAFFREQLATLGLGLEDRMKTKMGLLSGGQRQAVSLLMSTLVTPKLLLLDEHTAALDPVTAEKVLQITRSIIAQKGITAMMITHNISSALACGNRTIMMDDGQIVLDMDSAQRQGKTVEDVVALFAQRAQKQLDNDRMLLN